MPDNNGGVFESNPSSDDNGDRSPRDLSPIDPSLSGIEGWLIVPAIGVVLGPLASVYQTYDLFSSMDRIADSDIKRIAIIEIASHILLLLLGLFLAVQFFRKSRSTPRIYITYLLMASGSYLILLLLAMSSHIPFLVTAYGSTLVRSIVPSAIWIPYFLFSRRVRATFVR